MRQIRRVLLAYTKINLSLEYDSEGETSTGSTLPLYTSFFSIPPPQLLLPASINSLFFIIT